MKLCPSKFSRHMRLMSHVPVYAHVPDRRASEPAHVAVGGLQSGRNSDPGGWRTARRTSRRSTPLSGRPEMSPAGSSKMACA